MKEKTSEKSIAPVYNKEYLVVQANEIIRAEQDDLTLLEAKLLRFAIIQILQNDTDFKTFSIEITKLAKFLKMPKGNIYREVMKLSKSLVKKSITLQSEGKEKEKPNYVVFQWVSECRYKDGIITIRLHDNLKPYLLGLNELFTSYQYAELLELPTYYAIRLFELLASYQNIQFRNYKSSDNIIPRAENEVAFTIEQLRKYFQCENKYEKQANFIKRVIDKSVEAINEKTILRVSYRPITAERGFITHLVFKIGTIADGRQLPEKEQQRENPQ